jgi:hypothetical protein
MVEGAGLMLSHRFPRNAFMPYLVTVGIAPMVLAFGPGLSESQPFFRDLTIVRAEAATWAPTRC